MIDVAPTAAISAGAAVPLAALGRNTFEPGTGMQDIGAGPAASLDLGVRLAHHLLPHVTFERAWASCESHGVPCRATNDAIAFGLRVTSRGRFRVFGDLGLGLRWLTTDPTAPHLNQLVMLHTAGLTENRFDAGGGTRDIVWRGLDTIRLGVGAGYALRDEVSFELQLGCAIGNFREVRTATPMNLDLSPNQPSGFGAELRDDARKAYYLFGLSLAVRGFLPIR